MYFSLLQTFLGIIYENENNGDGIINILKYLHQFVSHDEGEEEERTYGDQGVVGDQLSVERAVNGLMSLSNGFLPEERKEGLHFEIADWHSGNKFLDVSILPPLNLTLLFVRKNNNIFTVNYMI